jgi:superfamily II RNA helicase
MAGRAGRRGMDTRGYVYHLFWRDMPMLGNYQHMLSGKPQALVSKFKMSSLTVLRTVSRTVLPVQHAFRTVLPVQHAFTPKEIDTITLEQLSNELTGTMIQQEIKRQYSNEETKIREKREKMKFIQEKMKTWETPLHILEQYHGMDKKGKNNKKDKKDKNERLQLAMKYNLTREYSEYRDWLELKSKLEISENVLSNIQSYIPRVVRLIVDHLCDEGRVVETADGYRLTELGNTITQFHEISPYVAHEMELLEECCRTQDGTIELLATFAGGIVRMDDAGGDVQSAGNSCVKQFFKKLDKIELDEDNWAYSQQEQIDVDDVGTRGVGLIDLVHQWCLAEDSERCKQILTEVHQAGVFLGEWVKMMLKMNHCAEELGRYFESQGKIECLKHCIEIPKLTLKSVVTNQSLYI